MDFLGEISLYNFEPEYTDEELTCRCIELNSHSNSESSDSELETEPLMAGMMKIQQSGATVRIAVSCQYREYAFAVKIGRSFMTDWRKRALDALRLTESLQPTSFTGPIHQFSTVETIGSCGPGCGRQQLHLKILQLPETYTALGTKNKKCNGQS